jgi:hypothetical protein
MPLQNVSVLVETCIFLHNLCIIHCNDFDKDWARKEENDILEESKKDFDNLHRDTINALNFAKESIKQMNVVLCTKDDVFLVKYNGIDLEIVEEDVTRS